MKSNTTTYKNILEGGGSTEVNIYIIINTSRKPSKPKLHFLLTSKTEKQKSQKQNENKNISILKRGPNKIQSNF
jgi:hypothetical protein